MRWLEKGYEQVLHIWLFKGDSIAVENRMGLGRVGFLCYMGDAGWFIKIIWKSNINVYS